VRRNREMYISERKGMYADLFSFKKFRFKRAQCRGAVKRSGGVNTNKQETPKIVDQELIVGEYSSDVDVAVSLDLESPKPTLECNFIEENNDNYKVFVCNRMRDGSVCEAETQTYIPVSKNRIVFSAINSTKSNTMRSKIKKIQRSVSNTLRLATRKNVIQMSSDVITMENYHY
jgi:hypothetical protein